MRLGILARMDEGGLAFQTHNLARMLRPDRLMVIDSTTFNHGRQHPERFEGFEDKMVIDGFPSDAECSQFLIGLTHVITCELPYNWELYRLASQRGIKAYAQQNWEFEDLLANRSLPAAYMALVPSHWHLADFQALYRRAVYLPPPTFPSDFQAAREANLARTGRPRFLHIVGHAAVHDRNGTQIVVEALKHTTADFELVIKAQPPYELNCDDHRVKLDLTNPDDQADLYKGYDTLLYPRRYGGLALPMNEALMSALPVIMSAVSPNDQALPAEWLVPATTTRSFMTRTQIPIYDTDPVALAAKIDWFCSLSERELQSEKARAFALGHENYSSTVLKPKYLELLNL